MLDRVVTRSAPRWAWEIIDETLSMDAQSKAFDKNLRQDIAMALEAVMISCEEPDRDTLTRKECEDA